MPFNDRSQKIEPAAMMFLAITITSKQAVVFRVGTETVALSRIQRLSALCVVPYHPAQSSKSHSQKNQR
jgi:hypothetical protein